MKIKYAKKARPISNGENLALQIKKVEKILNYVKIIIILWDAASLAYLLAFLILGSTYRLLILLVFYTDFHFSSPFIWISKNIFKFILFVK